MIAVVVLSHGPLAEALVQTAVGLLGPQREVHALGLGQDEHPKVLAVRLAAVVADTRAALLLCDLRGGTPHQVAVECASRMGDGRIEVVAGVNLGMLCEALVLRQQLSDVNALAARVVAIGGQQIVRSAGS